MYRENYFRSFSKSLSWRIAATATTITIAYCFVGTLSVAAAIGGVEFFSKFALYFFHERLWDRIEFGKVECPDGQSIAVNEVRRIKAA